MLLLRSVYKELHADRETGCWQQTAVCSRRGQHTACFVVRGFQRGFPFGTRLCLQSVVCYTLCRRCCENAVAAGEGKGIWNGRKTGLWLRGVEPQAQGWFPQQTGRIWKLPSFFPCRTSGQNVSNLWTYSRKNWNGREAILGLSRLDYPLAKTGGTVNGGAFMRRSSWPLTGSAGFAIFSTGRFR